LLRELLRSGSIYIYIYGDLDPLNLEISEPNLQLSLFLFQFVKIAFYNRIRTTADSVLIFMQYET
jgi:hypothetical protein